MGLDMHLNIKNYTVHKENDSKLIQFMEENGIIGRPTYFVTEVAYWRKCNQIHNWFVQNVQDGNDDCEEYPVSIENLQNLVDICKKVLDNNELAPELLPTKSGFFFGSIEYDEYYFKDIEHTIEMLDPLTKLDNIWFVYRSSW